MHRGGKARSRMSTRAQAATEIDAEVDRWARRWFAASVGNRSQRSPLRGLEGLDRVVAGVVEQDLRAAWAGDDVVAEADVFAAQPLDFRMRSSTINGCGSSRRGRAAAVERRPAGRAGRPLSSSPQRAAANIRECEVGARDQAEAEMAGVRKCSVRIGCRAWACAGFFERIGRADDGDVSGASSRQGR
jgi:hypothetical protein